MGVMVDPALCKTRLSWETVGNMCPVKSTFQVKIKDLAKQTNMCPVKSAFPVKIKDLAKQTKCKDWQVALTLELVVLGVVLLVTYLVILPPRLLPIQLPSL